LENFDDAMCDKIGETRLGGGNNNTSSQSGSPMTRVDSYDIPVQGKGGRPLKMFSTTRVGRSG
jgi:hypothetical protein